METVDKKCKTNEMFSHDLFRFNIDNVARKWEQLIDRRCVDTVFNTLDRRYYDDCMNSKECTPDLIKF